jgi:tRNA pseudouridine55 synthase
MKYKRHDLHGMLVVDKPLGMTSMGVIRVVRSAAGHCKTGHAGTLDPLATGILLCCFGKATKAVSLLMDHDKAYLAEIDLSGTSQTDDAEGPIEPVQVDQEPTESQIVEAVGHLTGQISQTPPAYSAVKVDGERAYKRARAGEDVQIKPRIVRIDRIEVLEYAWPVLSIDVRCGKGTYIRSLARQIGEAVGAGGYLTSLRRTAIGRFDLSMATTLENLPERLETEHLLPVPDGGAA